VFLYVNASTTGKKMKSWILGLVLFLISPLVESTEIQLRSSDGIQLSALQNQNQNSTKGVLLVHMENGSANDWEFFANRLKRSGFNTLAIDLRGHGGSRLPTGSLQKSDWAKMKADVTAGVDWLEKNGVKNIVLIGASIGANLALQVAAEDRRVNQAILLSPGHNIKGVRVEGLLATYGERPLFIAVSAEDAYASKTGLLLDSQAQGPHTLKILSGAGKGTVMLDRESSLASTIQNWINDPGTGADALAAPLDLSLEIPAAENEQMKTEGQKLPGF
jgi:pimeloyl-ACP methyl ester carboxylesterase